MIVKGGTAYINAGALDLSDETEQTIPGIYEAVSTALGSGKQVIIEIPGITPASAILSEGETGITAAITGYSILIAEDDGCTVTAASSEASEG